MADGTVRNFQHGRSLAVSPGSDTRLFLKPALINGDYAGVITPDGEILLFKQK